jgi:hypothetical protein
MLYAPVQDESQENISVRLLSSKKEDGEISSEDSKVSNQLVLAITCASFALFVIAE